MDSTDTKSKLQVVFDKVFLDKVEVTPTLSAKDVPEWDSLTHITLVVAVEKTFGIRFKTGEVERVKNVGEFLHLIQTRLAEKK